MKNAIDVRGRACPMPIVELMRAMKTLNVGEEVLVLADDAAFPADVRAWCKQTGNTLVDLVDADGAHEARVRKEEP
jgi:TusA-related sulfurtransferase